MRGYNLEYNVQNVVPPWCTADAEIKVPSVENPELTNLMFSP